MCLSHLWRYVADVLVQRLRPGGVLLQQNLSARGLGQAQTDL